MPLPAIVAVGARVALSKPGRKVIGAGLKKVAKSKAFKSLAETVGSGRGKLKKGSLVGKSWEQSQAALGRMLKYTPNSMKFKKLPTRRR